MFEFLRNICLKIQMWWYSRGIPTADANDEDPLTRDFLRGKVPVEVDHGYTDAPIPLEDLEDDVHVEIGLSFPIEMNMIIFKRFALEVSDMLEELMTGLKINNISLQTVNIQAVHNSEGDTDASSNDPPENKYVSIDLGPHPLGDLFSAKAVDLGSGFDESAYDKRDIFDSLRWYHIDRPGDPNGSAQCGDR